MANQGNNLHMFLCLLLIFTAKCVAAASDGNQDQLVVSDAQQQQPLLDSFHDEAALRATAERSLLKGKKSYGTDFGNDQQQLDAGQAGGDLGQQPLEGDSGLAQQGPAAEREKEAAEQRGLDKGRPVYYSEKSPPSAVALPDPSTVLLDNVAERPISDSATESGNEQTKLNGTDQPESQGNRVYQLLRTNFCVHVCMHTLPPWYSELSAPNCNTTTENECLKAPETRDDCKQRCPLIVKQLPRRPFFHCPAYCEIAYAGQQHTLKFCKNKCS